MAPRRRRFAAPRVIFALMLREMVTTYGRSPGGYLWAVVEPVAAIALLSFAFSMAFHAPSLGKSFPLFYATGYLPFMLFHDVSGKTATAVRFSLPLLNFATVTWVDVIAARFLLNLLTHLVVIALVIAGIFTIVEVRTATNLPHAVNALGMAAALALGTGALNAYLFMAFPVWERVWSVLTRPLFVVSGVFFLFEDLPAWVRDYLWLNPLFHVTGEMRMGFYPTYAAHYVTPSFAYGTGVALLLAGMMLMTRHHDELIHK